MMLTIIKVNCIGIKIKDLCKSQITIFFLHMNLWSVGQVYWSSQSFMSIQTWGKIVFCD